MVQMLVRAILQYDGCYAQDCKDVARWEEAVNPIAIKFQGQVLPWRYILIQKVVEVIEQGSPVVKVTLQMHPFLMILN